MTDFTPDNPHIQTPIVVDPNPLPAQALVALRSVLLVIGGMLVGRGWLTETEMASIVGAILILGPVVYQQFASRRNTEKLTVLAQAVPDSIAQIK